MGIKKFGDIKVLLQQIKELVDDNGNNVNDVNIAIANNEGNLSGGHYR